MSTSTAIKVWFCAAVAMIAAAIANPLIESASNAGRFGPGNFTDHSTWDVVPVLLVGLLFVLAHLRLRIRNALAESQDSANWLRLTKNALGRNVLRLVPLICAIQISVLCLMETVEQQVVYGHTLGGSLWIGGPIAISLATHAMTCTLIAILASKLLDVFADATVQLIQLIQALALLPARASLPVFLTRLDFNCIHESAGVLGHTGERAPPILTA